MHQLRARAGTLAILFSVLVSTPVRADLIYDNGPPNQANGDEMTVTIIAEDFPLAGTATLTDVRFWTIEGPGPGYNGSLTWSVYAHDSADNEPGALLFRANTPAVTRMATGNTPFGLPEFQNDFSVGAIPLAAGTYWLGLHNGPLSHDRPDEYFWETTNNNSTLRGRSDGARLDDHVWGDIQFPGTEHAFMLFGNTTTAVPEPSSLALLGLGTLGLLGYRWRRSQAKTPGAG